ncbi:MULTISPECIES: glutamate racemase [Reichenbachiella]|uniref:Glutamate racemase n=1 Tax=Reichenbachiella agariperforans TaxID=156994 RepID=A0A1M6QGJ0_REIAG|nr:MULTISPECIES: glutamate racemase [Reichenbachiella]MBU2914361.1 glutamate racemase [Reichenbachiella agariperforans]PIB35911.1 glutamate racemase [Reichenbachiella sp. 5M10]RJE73079.1 glutamate racemase [Reichenbachiella sp. MSK19-1]SHK19220.1 glutamate racemase [Reichenbachiella agariperforans]
MDRNAPIGIFDSGTGGLTVARAVKDMLPDEDMIYFGDSAHLPYGDKSATTIQSYSIKITNALLERGCKVILIACNSASAAAYELVKEYVGSRAKVYNVIDPVIDLLAQRFVDKKVGLIGTKQTVNSQVFDQKIKQRQIEVSLVSLATPLLVPMIEEGFINNSISHEIIAQYLGDERFEGIEALILGCTHYPIIKDALKDFYKNEVELIDSANIVAQNLKQQLITQDLTREKNKGNDQFLVSDITPAFEKAASLFFNQDIHLEKYPLWE